MSTLAAPTILTTLSIALTSILVLLISIYTLTLLRFKVSLHSFTRPSQTGRTPAPKLPYILPWLGNSTQFLDTRPHAFWARLFSWYPRSSGAVSILLGGQRTTVIFNAPSIQYVMKDRKMDREMFNEQVLVHGIGLSPQETEKFYGYHQQLKEGELSGSELQERMALNYMLRTDRVNELTADFASMFAAQLVGEFGDGAGEEVLLYKWLRGIMFNASTTAIWGTKVLEVVPDLEEYFFRFDRDMLHLFFGFPRWLVPDKVRNRDEAIDQLVRWYDEAEKEIGPDMPDPETVKWESCYGSRLQRARMNYYRSRGLSKRAQAGLDFGFLFGLSSNAIPATGWMLMHIIDSTRPENKVAGEKTLHEYVMAELKEAQNPDGTINVHVLVNQPVLLSTLHEVLRIYVDVLVSRQVTHDVSLPLASGKNQDSTSRSLFLKSGSLLMMPTYPAHTDPTTWQSTQYPHHPPPSVFYPYRFLTTSRHDRSEKPVFTTSHASGAFFPFGGGKTICPGRVFAKQEMVAAVATVLLTFDVEFAGFVDGKGRSTDKFPGLRDTFPGSAVMTASGDLKLKIRRREAPGIMPAV